MANGAENNRLKVESLLVFCSGDILHDGMYILHIYVYMHVGSYVWVYICVCRDIKTHIIKPVHIYVYMHACIHTYYINVYFYVCM